MHEQTSKQRQPGSACLTFQTLPHLYPFSSQPCATEALQPNSQIVRNMAMFFDFDLSAIEALYEDAYGRSANFVSFCDVRGDSFLPKAPSLKQSSICLPTTIQSTMIHVL